MNASKWEGGLTLEDAVDALTSITDTHWESQREQEQLQEEGAFDVKKALWLRTISHERSENVIKEIFRVILRHLQNYYQKEPLATNSSTLEGIKSIMLLVGEAAKKIDRFTTLFKENHSQTVTQLKEYHQLQEFYRRKIARTIDESILGKWILALTQRTWEEHERRHPEGIKSLETKHVFVDLDSVQKDTEYELFFIRKEDGTRFFSPRLIKNIKLVCDFGNYLSQEKEKDPLVDQEIWTDRFAGAYAQEIYKKVKPVLQQHYSFIVNHKDEDYMALVNKSVIALLLASNVMRLIGSGSAKSCRSYLNDFQCYVRDVIQHREFQKLVAFESKEQTAEQMAAKEIISAFLKAIFSNGNHKDGVRSYIHSLLQESNELISLEHQRAVSKSGHIWNRIACDFTALQKFLKRHPNGPLNKILSLIEGGDYKCYDPYMQQLFPEKLGTLHLGSQVVSLHCLPSPTTQEFIHQAKVIDEFQQFLRELAKEERKILLVNFHDRTSWREFSRAEALENLQSGTEFDKNICVITLPKDTEFYRQDPPYAEVHQYLTFKKHLLEHFQDNSGGVFIPDNIRKEIDSSWLNSACDLIHKIFFTSKNVLSKEMRQNFIEILYLFIQFKCLVSTEAKSLYFICKDGVDISPTAFVVMWIFSQLFNEKQFSEEEFKRIAEIIHVPALLCRERSLLPERFQKMLSAIKVMEYACEEMGSQKFVKELQDLCSFLFQNQSIYLNTANKS